MRNQSRSIFILLILSSSLLITHAQTNVSGGIYSNTTWTLANSPYIVVDTVVVFPTYTLTIEPGVVVKFNDHKRLEIRQGTLVAEGTTTDSIIFTSNSSSPVPGIWPGIFMNANLLSNFDYCKFSYAENGIELNDLAGDTTIVKNSNFRFNVIGFYSAYVASHSISNSAFKNNNTGIISGTGDGGFINNCTITHNDVGIVVLQNCILSNSLIDSNNRGIVMLYQYSTVKNCHISNNTIGIVDTIWYSNDEITTCTIENNGTGLKLSSSYLNVNCNKICNNTSYDLLYTANFGGDLIAPDNYWCTTDSSIIASRIYDGYDNINFGLVKFMPFDTSQCYLTGCNLGISATVINATCDTCHDGSATIDVSNGLPPFIYTWFTLPIQTTQTATGLAPGFYTVCVSDVNGCTACSNSIFIDSTNCTGYSIATHSTNTSCSLCNDGLAWVSVTGGTAPYSYTWYTFPIQTNDTAIGLTQGTYTVCVTDLYGCIACDSTTVSTGNCSAYFELYPDSVPHNYLAVNMASGISPLTFLWNWGDGTFDSIPFPSHTYSAAGFYTICLTIHDSVGCQGNYCNSYYLLKTANNEEENTIVTVNVVSQISLAIQNINVLQSWSIFPNPASGNSFINYTLSTPATVTLALYDVLGNKLQQLLNSNEEQGQHNLSLNTTKLANGIYLLQLHAGDQVEIKKAVVMN